MSAGTPALRNPEPSLLPLLISISMFSSGSVGPAIVDEAALQSAATQTDEIGEASCANRLAQNNDCAKKSCAERCGEEALTAHGHDEVHALRKRRHVEEAVAAPDGCVLAVQPLTLRVPDNPQESACCGGDGVSGGTRVAHSPAWISQTMLVSAAG